jgi:hypothetical protein
MYLYSELVYIGSITLITILIADFAVIEFVLKLGVFSVGNKWARILLLFLLFLTTLNIFLVDFLESTNLEYLTVAAIAWLIWNNLYFYMLIEQNGYWMSDTVKTRMFIALAVINMAAIPCGIIAICVYFHVVPISYFYYANLLDLIVLIYLSIVEIYLVTKVYFYSKSKLKPVSTELWTKVKFSIIVCFVCISLDVLNAVMENTGMVHYSYLFKPCVFTFKVIFECMCFQFIKGIIFTLDQNL